MTSRATAFHLRSAIDILQSLNRRDPLRTRDRRYHEGSEKEKSWLTKQTIDPRNKPLRRHPHPRRPSGRPETVLPAIAPPVIAVADRVPADPVAAPVAPADAKADASISAVRRSASSA